MTKKPVQRLSFDMDKDEYMRLKVICIRLEVTMKEFINEAINDKVKKEYETTKQ